jgi:hypothetical protein
MSNAVFISHKAEDQGIALVLKQIIQGAVPVEAFISEEIPRGGNWRNIIRQRVQDTVWFVLIYTDPTADWGWCLYETGYFEAIRSSRQASTSAGPVCLHHPDNEPPSPIADLQSVPAREDDVKDCYSSSLQS